MSFAILLTFLASASSAWAQFDTGAVLGTIRDAAAACCRASRSLWSASTPNQDTRTTDDRGAYEFFTVRVGTYSVKADLSGSSSREIPNVKVDVGARQRIDVELGVGALAEASRHGTGAAPGNRLEPAWCR